MSFTLVLETNGIRQTARHLAQIISLTITGTHARSLQLHIKSCHGNYLCLLPLPPQLICNLGNQSVVKTTNQFLQWYILDIMHTCLMGKQLMPSTRENGFFIQKALKFFACYIRYT